MGRVAEAMRACDALIIMAGAGMGVDSGLPDFRGTTGLWTDREVAMTYDEMSDDKWFFEDPAFAWGINYTQLNMYRTTEPHTGFAILLRLIAELGKPYWVFTSNIDCQFQKAGFPNDLVVACHGDLLHLQCTNGSCRGLKEDRSDEVWSADCIPPGLLDGIDPGTLKFRDPSILDEAYFRCPHCNELARPSVWFCHDRNHTPERASVARRYTYNDWVSDMQKEGKRVVVVECGGGLTIPSVRVEAEDTVEASGEGSLLVRINPSDCKVPAERAVGLPFGAREGIERVDAAVRARRGARSGSRSGPRAKSGPKSGAGRNSPANAGRADAGAPSTEGQRTASGVRAAPGAAAARPANGPRKR